MYEIGKYKIQLSLNVDGNQIIETKEEKVEKFQPRLDEYRLGWTGYSKDLYYFGVNRNIDYIKMDSIKSDPERENYIVNKMAVSGIQADDIKN